MIRNIILIDEDKCNGCGECIASCAEGALRIVNGKATLVSDNVCDGAGACLGHCPTGALRVIEREADAFDESAVQQLRDETAPAKVRHLAMAPLGYSPEPRQSTRPHAAGGCPGGRAKVLDRGASTSARSSVESMASELGSWPVKIRLMNPRAPYLKNANLLVAADCVPVAFGPFQSLLRGHVPLIGCPKFEDPAPYAARLREVVEQNELESVTVTRMSVPCCSGIVGALREAVRHSSQPLRVREVTISLEGEIIDENCYVAGGSAAAV